MAEPALAVENVSHTFHPGGPGAVRALRDVSLELEPGAFVVVLGTNGSGKSTLLNVIAGDFTPERGTIRVHGVDVTRWPPHRRASIISRVFQDPFAGTAPHLTVAENLALAMDRGRPALSFRRVLPRARRALIAERVEPLGMGLETRLADRIGLLSGGQRQALTLLMATLVRPRLLLLDEHTAALDPRSAEAVLRLTRETVEREALTVLMVTHSLQHAVRMGDRVLLMHQGRIAYDFEGARRRRLRADDLLSCFETLRNADMLDESAARMLRESYV